MRSFIGKKAMLIAVGIIVGILFASFNGNALAGEKVLRIRLNQDVQNFDPGHFTLHWTSVVLRAIYDNLIDYKVGSWPDFENQLATKVDVSSDRLTYTFYLKKGVNWQKGFGEVTAEDVKFSIERVMDPKTKAPMRSVWTSVIDRIEIPDKYTVRFFLKKRDPAFLSKLAPWRPGPIVSKKAVEKFGEDYGKKPEFTVGCGPFELEEYIPGQKVTLKKFEGYHGTKAKVDKIEMFIISDESTAVLSLQKGELDISYIRVPENMPTVRKDPSLNLYKGPSGLTKGFVAFNTEHPILRDLKVRRAMFHALDIDLIAEQVGGEMATKACGLLSPTAYWGALGCEDLPKYPYDPEKAKRLLAEAGYPKGFKMQYAEINQEAHRELAAVLQAYWKEVGIETEIELLPVKEWLTRLHKASMPVFKYVMGTRPPEPSLFLYSTFHSRSSRPGLNAMLYKGVDDLLDKAIETTDEQERKDLYAEIQKQVLEDCVMIPMFFENMILATQKNVDLGKGAKGKLLLCPYSHIYWLEEIDILND